MKQLHPGHTLTCSELREKLSFINFVLKVTDQYMFYLFLTKSSKEHQTLDGQKFIINNVLYIKINMVSLRTNQQPMPHIKSFKSVTLHLTVKNTLFQYFSTL